MVRRIFVVLALLVAARADASPATGAKPTNSARFRVTGPAGAALEGKTSAVDVIADAKSFTVIVDLRALSTGMAFRDDHMRKHYLETARFPTTQLVVDRAALVAAGPGTRFAEQARGALTLHGVTRTLPFSYRGTCDDAGACDVRARMPLNMNDFGIVVAPFLGLTVQSEVVVDVQLQVKP